MHYFTLRKSFLCKIFSLYFNIRDEKKTRRKPRNKDFLNCETYRKKVLMNLAAKIKLLENDIEIKLPY